jgi:hypothetical protein
MRTEQTMERLLAQMKIIQEKMGFHQEKIIAKMDAYLERM